MTDQEAQKEFDEALGLMKEIVESNTPGVTVAKAVATIPRLVGIVQYLLEEVKQLRAEVERLKTPQRTQYGGRS